MTTIRITHHDLISIYLPTRNYTIRRGYYSEVYIPKNRHFVIKAHGGGRDMLAFEYYKWCMENPASWKPKVYNLMKTFNSQGHPTGFIVWMKKYERMSLNRDNRVGPEGELRERAKKEISKHFRNKQLREGLDYRFDIHKNNVMMDRSTGRMIITDPVATEVD